MTQDHSLPSVQTDPAEGTLDAEFVVSYLQSYRVLDRGAVVGAEFELADGSKLELLIPTLALAAAVRNLIEAGRAAEQLQAAAGIAMDVVQATAVQGEPTVGVAVTGAIVMSFRARQTYPVAIAVEPQQARTLIALLQAALRAPPDVRRPQ